MREAPGWEPGRTVTVETTGGEVYQGVVVRFLPPGQLLVELQQQVREAQQQQVMESQQQQVMKSQWMRELVALPWEPSLRTVAATILLHAWSGSRTRRRRAGVFRTPSSDYFSKLAQAGDSRLQQVTGSMGVELVELGKEADAVLARRSWVQLETLEDLEIDVYNMRSWIAPHLEVLEGVCPWVRGEGGEEDVLTLGSSTGSLEFLARRQTTIPPPLQEHVSCATVSTLAPLAGLLQKT